MDVCRVDDIRGGGLFFSSRTGIAHLLNTASGYLRRAALDGVKCRFGEKYLSMMVASAMLASLVRERVQWATGVVEAVVILAGTTGF